MSFGIHSESNSFMASKADQHDALLMVELFKIMHSPEMTADWEWFTGKFNIKTWATLKKKHTPGSQDSMRLRRVLDFWEMVGAFVSHGVLNQRLLLDVTREPLLLWAKIEPWIGGARKELGANLWAFIEELAERAAAHADGE